MNLRYHYRLPQEVEILLLLLLVNDVMALWLAPTTRHCRRRSVIASSSLLIRPTRSTLWPCTTALFTSSASPGDIDSNVLAAPLSSDDYDSRAIFDQRRAILDVKLVALGIDATLLHEAVQVSMDNPTVGYNGAFGRSAIRTYRSFLYPKKENNNLFNNQHQLVGMAGRTAQQIDFLLKRHASHQQEWVRHHDAAVAQRQKVFPMILVLDNLRSAFNVGSIFRTADATGCAQVVTTGITPHPRGNGAEKVAKSALGAHETVPSVHFGTTRQALEALRVEYPAYTFLGMETTEKSRLYTDINFPAQGVVIVLGNEVTGLDTNVMPLLDELVEIPMFGVKNSLNVASCAPIVLYEIVRQWNTASLDNESSSP